MFRFLVVVTALPVFANPAAADSCASLVKSVCPGSGTEVAPDAGRRVLTVEVQPPDFAVGDLFPVDKHSLLMNPTRYGLPGSDGTWRYYALDGTVYRVDTATAEIIEVIRDQRTWGLR